MTCGDLELDNEGHATIDLEVRPCTSPASSHAGPAEVKLGGGGGAENGDVMRRRGRWNGRGRTSVATRLIDS